MIIEAIDPTTGNTIHLDLADSQSRNLVELSTERISDNKLSSYLDNLDISADAKLLLENIRAITIKVGNAIVTIGKKILEIIVVLIKKFPNTAVGILVGLFLSILVASVPLIGTLLALTLKPWLVLFGIGVGLKEDLKDKSLSQMLDDAVDIFSPLKTAT